MIYRVRRRTVPVLSEIPVVTDKLQSNEYQPRIVRRQSQSQQQRCAFMTLIASIVFISYICFFTPIVTTTAFIPISHPIVYPPRTTTTAITTTTTITTNVKKSMNPMPHSNLPLQRRNVKITTTTRKSALCLSFLNNYNWDDIVYQTESIGNAIASFSLPQDGSSNGLISNTGGFNNIGSISNNNSNMMLAFPIMYIAGLFTSFSPCVWGLLPLTISYISTAANERSDQRTILPTLAFAAGLASVFCTMGMITVFTVGSVFGGSSYTSSTAGSDNYAMAYTTTMILPVVSNFVCFVMGLKLLDLVDIALPSFNFLDPQQLLSPTLSSRTTGSTTGVGNTPILLDATGKQVTTSAAVGIIIDTTIASDQKQKDEGNALFRTFLLGGSSALVASPCATPVLTSILAYVANTMTFESASSHTLSTVISTIMGGFLLFGYTLGYATPLLIVAATSGQALVRLNQNQKQSLDQPQEQEKSISSILTSVPNRIAPWVTPITGGILIYLGTTGLLVNIIGDPSLSGLKIIE